MGRTLNAYDVYDEDWNEVAKSLSCKEVKQLLKTDTDIVSIARRNVAINGYYVRIAGKLASKAQDLAEFEREWEAARAVFKNVKWVKQMAPDVIRLKG